MVDMHGPFFLKLMLRRVDTCETERRQVTVYLPFSLPSRSYIAATYPATSIVAEEFGESESHVLTVHEYWERARQTYDHGSHQAGAMRNISLVGAFQVWAFGFNSRCLFSWLEQ